MPRLFLSLTFLVLLPRPAAAFTIESPISAGCHERITVEALARVGWPDGERPPSATPLERRLIDVLPFDLRALPGQPEDPWTLALVLGVRDNDLLGAGPFDFAALSAVHSADDNQVQHCLRRAADDGAAGDASAIAACRAFIRAELAAALGAAVLVDERQERTIDTLFQGPTRVPLSRFAFHTGKALHAVEDSFTHGLRSADALRLRSVLNWVDWAARPRDYAAARDGHRHLSDLDHCDGDDEARRLRVERATEAAAALLAAIAAPAEPAARLAAADVVLDQYLGVEGGCDAQNDWCGELEEDGCAIGGAPRVNAAAILFVLALVAVGRRRLLVVGLCMVPVAATAEPRERFALSLSAGLSAQHTALDVRAGLRGRLSERVHLGLELEYNPWLSIDRGRASLGTFNAAARLGLRWARFGRWEVRSALHAGASVLLTDLIGAEAGSVGPFVVLSPVSVVALADARARITIEPEVAVVIPQVRAVPIVYEQYRLSVGVEWWAR